MRFMFRVCACAANADLARSTPYSVEQILYVSMYIEYSAVSTHEVLHKAARNTGEARQRGRFADLALAETVAAGRVETHEEFIHFEGKGMDCGARTRGSGGPSLVFRIFLIQSR